MASCEVRTLLLLLMERFTSGEFLELGKFVVEFSPSRKKIVSQLSRHSYYISGSSRTFTTNTVFMGYYDYLRTIAK